MKKIRFFLLALVAGLVFASCERVAPNYAGVLMENYGKEGKSDFKVVSGKVSTWEWGTELFQVPLFDQRGEFAEPVTLKAADNTEFNARPTYSYKVIKERAIDVVFDNKHIDKADTEAGKDGFMQSLEDNILEPRIYDLIKEESRKHKTDSLMADGGSLIFEKRLEEVVEKEKNHWWGFITPDVKRFNSDGMVMPLILREEFTEAINRAIEKTTKLLDEL